MVKLLINEGFHAVCIGPRGQQGIGQQTSSLAVSPGRETDIREVVEFVHNKYCKDNQRLIFGCGFSYGANNFAKMVGIDGEKCKLEAVFSC